MWIFCQSASWTVNKEDAQHGGMDSIGQCLLRMHFNDRRLQIGDSRGITGLQAIDEGKAQEIHYKSTR